MRRDVFRIAWGVAGLVLIAAAVAPTRLIHAQSSPVDLALVLALDCSASVDEFEFAQQVEGLGRAFQRAEVQEAIGHGTLKRIAVSVVQWSGKNGQITVMPWTVIASAADANRIGAKIEQLGRHLEPGATSISSALIYSDALLDQAPPAGRRVIDVTADGPNNVGGLPNEVRDILVAKGTVINALTIRNEWRHLDLYFENEVVGGQDSFVIPTRDYSDYAEAIYLKLVREITGPRIS